MKREKIPHIAYTQEPASGQVHLLVNGRGVHGYSHRITIQEISKSERETFYLRGHRGHKLVLELPLANCPHVPWETLAEIGEAEDAEKKQA